MSGTGNTPIAGAAPAGPTAGVVDNPLFEYLCRLADDRMVLGHRLSEWCGHGPILEEDIALANFALDFVGQASALYTLAGEVEGQGRDADALAFLRDENEYRNVQLAELPRGDFGFTILRQYLFDVWDVLVLRALTASAHPTLAGIAGKALKEAIYHRRHTEAWVVRLGDGTPESHERMQAALNALWAYTAELFAADGVERGMAAQGIGVDPHTLRGDWERDVQATLARATLSIPSDSRVVAGGRIGRHSEHLGHMLAQMQILPRSHPGAQW